MVLCSTVLILSLWLASALSDPQVFNVSASATSNTALQGLTEALKQTAALPSVQLHLLADPKPFRISTPVLVSNALVVLGNYQTIDLAGRVTVSSSAYLEIAKARLVLGENNTLSSGLRVQGTCVLAEIIVEAMRTPLVALSGTLTMSAVELRNCTAQAILVTSTEASLQLKDVVVVDLTASFLSAQRTSNSPTRFLLSAWNCTFTNSSLSNSQGLFNFQGLPTQVTFSASQFEGNSGLIFVFNGKNYAGVLTNCSFQGNHNSLLIGNLANSSLLISDCFISNNAEVAINLSQFDGQFLLLGSVVTRQSTKGPISISNLDSSAQCLVTLSHSTISLFNLTVSGPTPGVITLYACLGLLSHVQILNVTVVAPSFNDLPGLLSARLGALSISHLSLEDSGSSGFLIIAFSGSLNLTDFTILRPVSGSGVFVGCLEGVARMENGYATLGQGVASSVRILKSVSTYFGTLQGVAWIRNITIEPSGDVLSSLFGFQYSEVSIDRISVRDAVIGSVLAVLTGNCSASNISIEGVAFNKQPLSATLSTFSLTGLFIVNSRCVYPQHGLFIIMHHSIMRLRQVRVSNVTAGALMRVPFATLAVEDIVVELCKFDLLVHYSCNAAITFKRLSLRNSQCMLLFDTNSSIAFTDSSIDSLYSGGVAMGGYGTRLSFANMTVTGLRARGFGRFSQGGSLSILHSSFLQLVAEEQLGWEIAGGSLYIHYSRFQQYTAALFQVKASNVSMTQATFLHGQNPTQSLASRAAYGGVLSCVDCAQVSIAVLHISNVSAKTGGALAFDVGPGVVSKVTISSSRFIGCSAIKGGAMYTHSVSFHIEASLFLDNSAKETGGAIYSSVRSYQSALILHSQFVCNRANEGGAVKWSSAPVSLINTTFDRNTAVYGADVASYGVTLSPRLTQLTGTEVTGTPLTLVYELLDHYGHRVILSPFLALYLTDFADISYRGNEIALLNQGLFNFTGVTIYAQPGVTHTIQVLTNYTQEDYFPVLMYELQIPFRNCSSGEVYRLDQCEYCFAGNVSFSPSDSACMFCPENGFCPGGNQVIVDEGYWRNTWNSTKLHRCPLPEKCLGGENSTCALGFTGKVCNQCSPGTYRIRGIECIYCEATLLVIFQICVPLLLFIAYLWTVLYFSVLHPSFFKLLTLKTLLTHLQSLAFLSYLRLSFPPAITYFLHSLSYFSSLLLSDLPLSCLSATPYSKAIAASLLGPFLCLISLVVCWTATKSWRTNTLIAVSSSLLLSSFGSVQVLGMILACGQVDTEDSVLFFDMDETCWQGTHLKITYCLVIPSMILNVILPFTGITVLHYANPQALDKYFPLWTSGYKCKLWEISSFLTRGLLSWVASLTLYQNSLLQLCYSFIILIVACGINVLIWARVYTQANCFLLAESSLVVVSLSVGFLSYYLSVQAGQGGDYFFSAIVLVLNVGFLLVCVYVLVRRENAYTQATGKEVERPKVMEKADDYEGSAVLQVPENSLVKL